MKMNQYFEEKKGLGILSTVDDQGNVDAAIYARPHLTDDGLLAFIMRDRLTHHNLQSNPHAVYLFKEEGSGYKGKRLYLTKVGEEEDNELIKALSRRKKAYEQEEARFLVIFRLNETLPLVGDGK